jgi:magnesium transporter
MPEQLRPYFRDLGDHLLRVTELSGQHDILLGTVLEASRSRQAVQQNDDMRKISAWVAMAAVPTMIAGIYGMNFDNMPELHQQWGYPVVLVVMVTACTLMFRAFKRSRWL